MISLCSAAPGDRDICPGVSTAAKNPRPQPVSLSFGLHLLAGSPLMGIRTSCPQVWLLGMLKYLFKINGRSRKIVLTLTYPSSPKIDHKVFVWKVPSLDLEEKSILISEDNGISRRILTNRTCYTYLIFSNIKFLRDWALCSNLA